MKSSLIIIFLLLTSLSPTVQAQTVYLSPTAALKTIFNSSQEIVTEKKSVSADQQVTLKKILGQNVTRTDWTIYLAKTKGQIDGYALIDNEVGKTEPITFLTAISPKGEVKDVEVLVYRESYGSEVHEKPFLKQYNLKTVNDPIRIGQDIKHISGATLSSRAISTGVKRDLAIWNLFYGTK